MSHTTTAPAPRVRGAAVFDPTGRFRYSLTRSWDPARPRVAFVLLNPNRADAARDDPTIRRCVGFARSWGYGSLAVVNLFAYRARHFAKVRAAPDPVGPENDAHIGAAARTADLVVLAWGAHGAFRGRDLEVRALLAGRRTRALGHTRAGHPAHPLYLSKLRRPVSVRPARIPRT